MTVLNGQKANQTQFNSSFMSREEDTSTVGKVVLENSGSSTVSDAQLQINKNTRQSSSTESIAASGTVSTNTEKLDQVRPVQGDGAAVTTSGTPFGNSGGWPTGTIIRLVGKSDSNTVKIEHNDSDYGAMLNGDATLKKFFILELMWDNNALRWIERIRNF